MNREEKRQPRKKSEKAVTKVKPVQSVSPSTEHQTLPIQQHLQMAVQHHTAGRLPQAESICQQVLQADPNQPVALHLLGVIARQVGKDEAAVELITQALAIQPDYAEAHLNLGIALKTLGRLNDAIDSYRRALDIKPDMANAHFNLGNALRASGQLDAAVDSYRRAINISPDSFVMHETLADTLQALGSLDNAVESYTKALAIDPQAAEAHARLGGLYMQLGRTDDAIVNFRHAIAVRPEYAEAHTSLGTALKGKGLLDNAIASFTRAIEINPGLAVAHNNLGNTLEELGRPGDASASYHKALAIDPDYAEAHSNLGLALREQGLLDEAVASCRRAVAIQPDFAGAHSNLGNALQDLGKLDEAVASYRKALAIQPDFAEAHSNLGNALMERGDLEEAFTSLRRAVALSPQNDSFWAGWAAALETYSFTSVEDDLWQDLLDLINRPTVRPSYVTQPIISALRQHPDFSQILGLTGSAGAEIEISYGDVAERLSAIPLFLRIMGLSLISDLQMERMLTFLRRAMLEEALAGKTAEKSLPFSAALALQCFTNEYVFPETDEEKTAVEQLQQQIAALVEKERDVPPSLVAALGAYRPLGDFPWARELSERAWADNIGQVIERQITEPLEQQSLRDQIPRLTAIQNTVSQSVREQYEENPYPRWVKTDITDKSGAIGAVLQGAPLRLDLRDYQSPENPEILVAGCGTGQHALNTATRFSNARVLAVDLSLSSLSYALRKTKELDVSNIEYSQADIMELTSLGRRFDVIESVGVLHHIGDPLAGWRVLVDLLHPKGLMKIGLYSEASRQDIIRGRALIAEKGYTTSPDDMRRCRQDIIAMAGDGNSEMAKICIAKDFFSLSECRDLLFHVQEHRFTLPQIETSLKTLNLKFLGFEMRDHGALRKFTESHPDKSALTSLDLWHAFELKNPDTFRGMYQFWCKKI